jgi:hypothetical protein
VPERGRMGDSGLIRPSAWKGSSASFVSRGFSEVRTGHRTWVPGIMLGVENAASVRGESARVASYLLGNGRLGITET